jgi:WD repeat-containing protein 19
MSIVNILTSAVIECQRGGLKAASYEYAVMLMRPEYRSSMTDPALKRKIEAIVRRRVTEGEEPPEETSLCPISSQLIPITQLECPTTRDALPMCVVSGRHMVMEDWCFCPVSKFPALYSEYVRYIENEIKAILALGSKDSLGVDGKFIPASLAGGVSPSSIGKKLSSMTAPDPVLGKPVAVSDLKIASPEEAMKYIQRYNNVVEKKEPSAEGEEGVTMDSGKANGNSSPDRGARDGDRDSSASPPKKSSNSRSHRERAQKLKDKNRKSKN